MASLSVREREEGNRTESDALWNRRTLKEPTGSHWESYKVKLKLGGVLCTPVFSDIRGPDIKPYREGEAGIL